MSKRVAAVYKIVVQITEYCVCWCYTRYLLHRSTRSDPCVKCSGNISEGKLLNSYWLCFKDSVRNLTLLNQFTSSQDEKL